MTTATPDVRAKAEAEYAAHSDIFAARCVTKEQYVRSRLIDEGVMKAGQTSPPDSPPKVTDFDSLVSAMVDGHDIAESTRTAVLQAAGKTKAQLENALIEALERRHVVKQPGVLCPAPPNQS